MLRADGQHAPITPNYNHSNEDKQWIMRHLSPLTPSMAQGIDNQHNNRWETLLSVDDYIGTLNQKFRPRKAFPQDVNNSASG